MSFRFLVWFGFCFLGFFWLVGFFESSGMVETSQEFGTFALLLSFPNGLGKLNSLACFWWIFAQILKFLPQKGFAIVIVSPSLLMTPWKAEHGDGDFCRHTSKGSWEEKAWTAQVYVQKSLPLSRSTPFSAAFPKRCCCLKSETCCFPCPKAWSLLWRKLRDAVLLPQSLETFGMTIKEKMIKLDLFYLFIF